MTLFRPERDPVHMSALARAVYDVTGAGDTVIATLAAAVGAGLDLEQAANLANVAAGIVVEQVGTTAIKAAELRAAFDKP
jgi:D-beta-D-heptose 7-phosphate kinase/D-beta-D-heptose 1-phosphate adenosyltransferase